jgi:hypothetical protein
MPSLSLDIVDAAELAEIPGPETALAAHGR